MDTNRKKHYNIDQKDEGTLDDRRRDGGTNFILRIKEQEKRLTLHEHDDDDDDDDDVLSIVGNVVGLLIEALCYNSEGRGFDSR